MFLSPNTLLRNRYLIVRQIGQGGMGAVYEAKDQRLGHRVALKQMILNDETFVRAFEREGRMLAQLDHPVLPHVSDFFTEAGSHFLVMQYIPGDDLKESLGTQAKPFPVEKVVEWMDQLLDGLEYLHSHSPPIIHRDIKPANLKLSSQGRIILLDFGISKGGQLDQTRLTTANKSLFAYTLRYAPLEQMDGQGTDERSDLYSLAATFYHLLTATELPTATTRAGAQIKHTPDPLLSANLINRQVPVGLANLLSQAMALNPDHRPQSAKLMRVALQQAMSSQRPINKPRRAPNPPTSSSATTILEPRSANPPMQSGVMPSYPAHPPMPSGVMRPHSTNPPMPSGVMPPHSTNPANSSVSDRPFYPSRPNLPQKRGFNPWALLAVLVIAVLSVTLLLMVVNQSSFFNTERGAGNVEEPVAVMPTLTEQSEIEPTPVSLSLVEPTSTESPTIEPTSTESPTVEPTSTESPTIEPTSTESPTIEPTSTEPPTVEPTSTKLLTVEPTLTEPAIVTVTPVTSALNAEPAAGASSVSEKDGMTMLYVPAGEFLMGSKADDPLVAEHEHETPQRSVFLDGFWIDQTEVTNAMFAKFVEETEHETYAEKEQESYVYVGEGDWEKIDGASWQFPRGTECDCELEEMETHPVVQVTWDDARLYCEWAGRRLPTEAEWEKAARGPDGRLYPWGDAELAGNLLNVCDGSCPLDWANDSYDDRFEFTAPVGSYSLGESPYGARDMMGNVWEWVADWYDKDYYKEMPENNPSGPESRQERVLRGGSWSSGAGWVRTSFRHRDPPTDPNDERGFRCASSP